MERWFDNIFVWYDEQKGAFFWSHSPQGSGPVIMGDINGPFGDDNAAFQDCIRYLAFRGSHARGSRDYLQ